MLFYTNYIIFLYHVLYAYIGTTGCTLSDDLGFDEYTPQPIREVKVTILCENQIDELVLIAKATRDNIFVVNSSNIKWFKNLPKTNGNLPKINGVDKSRDRGGGGSAVSKVKSIMSLEDSLGMCVYIHMCICVCVYTHVYLCMYVCMY